MAPADRNHLANKDSRSLPSHGGVSETHYQGLQNVVAFATARKLPGDSCLLKAELPWRQGRQARLICGSRARQVGRHFSALVGTYPLADLSYVPDGQGLYHLTGAL